MSRGLLGVVGALWACSIVAAFMLGRDTVSRGPIPEVSPLPQEGASEVVGAKKDLADYDTLDRSPPLEISVSSDAGDVEQPSAAEPKPDNALLRHALDNLRKASALRVERPETALTVEELLVAIGAGLEDSSFGVEVPNVFGDAFYRTSDLRMSESMALVVELVRRPGRGIPAIREMLLGPGLNAWTATEEELKIDEVRRRFAREYLAAVAAPEAFDILLELQDRMPEGEGLGFDSIQSHVEYLPPDVIAEYAPLIFVYTNHQVRTGDYGEAPLIASQMAFVHGHREFLRFLMDDRALTAGVDASLNHANLAHSRDAWRFLRFIAAGHQTEDTRTRAEQILDEW